METYFDDDYTLKKLSTSEYVRDPRFKPQMMALKVGSKPTRIVRGNRIGAELKKINWATHAVLCHNTQFDGFILSHHYGVVPAFYYDTLSMARGLHSNEIGAGLDEVAKFYGGRGKIDGILELTKGVLEWPKALYDQAAVYCGQDNDECFRIFKEMHAKYPADEIELIDLTVRMFCDPVLKVDIPRVQAELDRELQHREKLFFDAVNPLDYAADKLLKGKEKLLPPKEADMLTIKRVLGSNERFAELLRAEGIEPPRKISPAWMKKDKAERRDEDKYTYAFAKDDLAFKQLPENIEMWGKDLDLNNKADIKEAAKRQARIQTLVDCRIAVKSTTNITRAQRFLTAGARGMSLPCGYAYFRAHTGRWGGNNKMNMQNLTRGGELRLSILAAKGHQIAVADSGQIEARVNGWLWGQQDLLDRFLAADNDKNALDNYCHMATSIYGRAITKADKDERHVGKVCVLGLGFQMGAPKLQMTLAKGALGGPPVFFTLDQCKAIVNTYRRLNYKIEQGWKKCNQIIEDMAAGVAGRHKCISWEADTIWLPNGMSLKYPDLKKGINEESGYDEWTYAAGADGARKKIYGGLLCENIVQALARIIVGSQMLTISRKHRVVMTTHDEVVAHPKTAQAQRCYEFMEKTMKTPLAWCMDLPLNAEGGFAANYSK
ncbi:MAG: hypothetical protein JSS14_22195 [Proteobacteria bacterium]|nr:hypothetical protein [Pseudomonadota bacterium]